MTRRWKKYIAVIIVLALVLTGCTGKKSGQADTGTGTAAEITGSADSSASATAADPTAAAADDSSSASDGTAASTEALSGNSQIVVDKEFTANDLDIGYDDTTAAHIVLNGSSIQVNGTGAKADNSVLTITTKGTYVISGTLNDGQIIVDAKDTDKIHLVLNGVIINCSNNAAIYIKAADKVFITLEADTVNSLSDGSSYVQQDVNNVDGVIFSKADLALNGEGSLNITGNYKNGIVSKDDLIITGGTYQITTVDNSITGKDCVKIKDGTFNLSSTEGNGIKSKNSDDTTKGYVYIAGGKINILNCQEGIEGMVILIEGGEINITAQDDGMNAANGAAGTSGTGAPDMTVPAFPGDTSSRDIQTDAVTSATVADNTASQSGTQNQNSTVNQNSTADQSSAANPDNQAAQDSTAAPDGMVNPDNFTKGRGGFGGGGANGNDTNCILQISGGTVNVNAAGDGIDSNGSLYITGGTVYVSGPTSNGDGGLDYNGAGQITGGIVVVASSSGMAECFDDTSTQYALQNNFTNTISAGTEIKLTDAQGNTVVTFTPAKEYQSVVISSPQLVKDGSYKLTCGDQSADITLSSVITSNGQQQGFGGMGGLPGQGRNGFKPGH